MRALRSIVCCGLLLLFAPRSRAATAIAVPPPSTVIDPQTWVDHDAQPIREPATRKPNLRGLQFHEAVVEPFTHAFDVPDKLLWLMRQVNGGTKPQSVNVNAFDEVPNSSWFTNRNHVKAWTPRQIRLGAGKEGQVPVPPYVIKSFKQDGVNPGFNIKDAAGQRWVVKFDPVGFPQLGSGADAVVSRLIYAAGYNVPHDVPFRFRRESLRIDSALAAGEHGALPFAEADLDSLLARGARDADGQSVAQASLFLTGKPIGPTDMHGRRRDDANDWYEHRDRRELRGLYVLMSWLDSWDTKDQQSLDTFIETQDSLGAVRHHLLDLGASLGAAAEGPKSLRTGYEYKVDWGWIALRMASLGFAVEPWRGTQQASGIPSVGSFESADFQPDRFKPLMPHPAFGRRTARDSYWGAKLVASFSVAQIAAAIDAAGYADPRAKPVLLRLLVERRDKVTGYWFSQVAPVDFFHVDGSTLRFSDLAVDTGQAPARAYSVRVLDSPRRRGAQRASARVSRVTAIELDELHPGDGTLALEVGIEGQNSAPATLHLVRSAGRWKVVRVVHG